MLHCFSLARLNSSQFYFHSFTFNSQLLYELKHKVHLSENVCGIFYFQFCLGFIQVYIFVPQKDGVFDFKMFTKSVECLILKFHNPFKNENNRKTAHSLLPDV